MTLKSQQLLTLDLFAAAKTFISKNISVVVLHVLNDYRVSHKIAKTIAKINKFRLIQH
jgi:hypothetical protein